MRKGPPLPHSLAIRRGGWPPQRPTPSVGPPHAPPPCWCCPLALPTRAASWARPYASRLPAERSPKPRLGRKGPPESYCSLFERGLKTVVTPRAIKGASKTWPSRSPNIPLTIRYTSSIRVRACARVQLARACACVKPDDIRIQRANRDRQQCQVERDHRSSVERRRNVPNQDTSSTETSTGPKKPTQSTEQTLSAEGGSHRTKRAKQGAGPMAPQNGVMPSERGAPSPRKERARNENSPHPLGPGADVMSSRVLERPNGRVASNRRLTKENQFCERSKRTIGPPLGTKGWAPNR